MRSGRLSIMALIPMTESVNGKVNATEIWDQIRREVEDKKKSERIYCKECGTLRTYECDKYQQCIECGLMDTHNA